MQLPKCQCQPDLDSVLRKACVNEIGKLLTYCQEAFQSIMSAQLNVSQIMSPSENFLKDALESGTPPSQEGSGQAFLKFLGTPVVLIYHKVWGTSPSKKL